MKALVAEGARGAADLGEMIAKLEAPRTVWLMLPAGAPTDETIAALTPSLQAGDAVIDGGNSYYRDDLRRAKALQDRGLHYLDVGVSGGVWGLERGYCLMIGGDTAQVGRLDPIFNSLAPGLGDIPRTPRPADADLRAEQGYIHTGPVGSGHFVKMVHNGVEYGLMQAYAEGFDILKGRSADTVAADERYDLNMADIAEVWRRGSVVFLVAARPDRPRPWPRTPALTKALPATWPTAAKAAGPSRRRSSRPPRPRC